MVAVISGNGLGLLNGSLSQLGQAPGSGSATIGQGKQASYVNAATGNLVLQSADSGLIFDGLAISQLRTYNSQGVFSGGYGWSYGFNRKLTLSGTANTVGSSLVRTSDDGDSVTYAYDATSGLYLSSGQSGTQDSLSWNAGGGQWTWTDGSSRQQETYNAAGQLTGLSDLQTGASYTFGYSNGVLSTITAGDGDQLQLSYNGAGQLTGLAIREIPPGGTTAVTRTEVTYGYDPQGRLNQVLTSLASDSNSSSQTYSTSYTYDGASNRVASMTQGDGTSVSYTYTLLNGNEVVSTVTTGVGAAAQVLTFTYGTGSTTVSDASGHVWTYAYAAGSDRLTQVTAPTVNGNAPTTQYAYDANGNLTQVIDALGQVSTRSYDSHGNLLSTEDAAGDTVSYTYNADNQVLTQTTYRVAAQGVVGQPGYVAPSGAQTRYYIYDANDRLTYAIDATGAVTRNTYNAAGLLVTTQQYLGVLYPAANLSLSAPPSLATMASWATGQSQATTTRTDYAYDVRGQLSSRTVWDNVDTNGVGVLDAGTTITTYVYDAQGLLRQQVTEHGANRTTLETTSYTYDGLGRVLGSTDALGHTTTYQYTDSSNTVAVTQANGLTTTQIRNSAGLLISSTQSASGLTARTVNTLYNALGEPVAQIDAAGNISYTFYDADGRISGTLDALGDVVSYVYDADGRVTGTTQYANTVSTTGWVSAGALTANLPSVLPMPSTSTSDRTSELILDAVGRTVASVDAAGDVVTITYDGEGDAIAKDAYATPLTAGNLTALRATPTWTTLRNALVSSGNDRLTQVIVDADQRPVATIDAAGYVVVTTYDAAGRAIKTVAYATALTASGRTALNSTPTLATLQANLVSSVNDQVTRTTYDAAGEGVAQIDADGYLTTTAYDQTTHSLTRTRYATALTSAQLGALTGSENVAVLVALLGSSPVSQTSVQTYDADGQLSKTTAADGTVTTYAYNLVGQPLSRTITPVAGQGAARTSSATYDAFGEALTQTDAAGAVTTMTYTAVGEVASATDALGNTTWSYYDADDRLIYTIQGQPNAGTRNALGVVTAYLYGLGQVTSITTYSVPLNLTTSGASTGTTLNTATATATQVSSAIANLIAPAGDPNANTAKTYTQDGQLASVTDGDGYQTLYTYDAFGDVVQTQQQLSAPGSTPSTANSTISTATYDARGERTGETDGVGTPAARSTASTYDAFGRVTSTTDGDGHTVTYGYDPLGRQISTSLTVGGTARTTQTTYDAFDRVVRQTDALGNVTVYQYALATHTVTLTTPDGVTMTTVKDAYGDTVSVTDGAGDITRYSYDGDGRLLQTTDALGNLSTNQYDLDGHLIQTTDATGHIVTTTYDASGRVLTRTVDPAGLNQVTRYTYDATGRTLSITDPLGAVTTYAYDADGNVLTQVVDAGSGKLNLTTTSTYDGAGKALTVTVGAGTSAARTTQYVYDALERLSQQIVDPNRLHLVTSYTYDGNNNLTSVTDANGHVTRNVYDEANEKLFGIDAAGKVTQYSYDVDGHLTATHVYATALTTTQLGNLGMAPAALAVSGVLAASVNDAVTYTAYNAEGQVRYVIDPLGEVTERRYDAAGRLSETLVYAHAVTLSAAQQTSLQQGTALASLAALVSSAGNTDANAEVTAQFYDADGQARFTVRQNTVNGQLVGVVSEQRYDAAGRVIATLQYGSTVALNGSQALSTQMSTSSLAQSLAGTASHLTQSVYDNAGQRRYVIDATQHVTETQYDADGRVLKTLTYANAITVPGTLTVASVGAAVTAAGTTGARYTSTTYDNAGRVTYTGDALGTNASYTYDATGLQTAHADRDGNWTYDSYDAAGRKTLEQSPAVEVGSYSGSNGAFQSVTESLYTQYGYDGVGNVTAISQGAGPDAAHITVLSTTGYTYDAVGHQIQTTYPGNIATHTVYNALGQAVVDQDANGNYQYKVYTSNGQQAYSVDADGYVTATTYDAFGNAIAVTRYATALNTAAITGWSAGQALTGAQIQQGLVTSSSDRTITTTYNLLNQKLQVQQSAITYYLVMGPVTTAAAFTGSPTTTYTYDAYGNQTSSAVLIQGANATGDANATPAIWATTYTYYDALNRATMTVTPTGLYTAPQGYVTTTSYNGLGDVLSTTQYATAIAAGSLSVNTAPSAPAASTSDRTSTYGYDAIGRKNSETDTGIYSSTGGIAAGNSVTTIGYDGENRVTSLTVNGQTTTTIYNAVGKVHEVIGPAYQALVSNWQTLLQQNPSWDLTTAALYTTVNALTYNVYDGLGHALLTTVTNQQNTAAQQTYLWYDARGNLIQQQDADGTEHYSTYDYNGNVLTQSYTLSGDAGSSTVTSTYTYDADNQQLTQSVQRSGQSGYDSYVQVKYNAFGEVIGRGDNTGIVAHYGYDNDGNLISAPDAKTGAAHTYLYDLAGHLMADQSTVTGGSATTWVHSDIDLSGHAVWRRTPSSSAPSGVNTSVQAIMSYDRWGNLLSSTDAAGNTTQYQYDSQNHLIREIEPNVLVVSASGTRAWTTPTKTWYYNVSGQRLGVTDEDGNTTLNTYDATGHLTVAQDGVGNKTYTAYDALGRAVAQQTPPANTATGPVAHITYTNYDALNQVVAQGDFLLNSAGTARTQQAQETYTLDSNGDRIQVTDALGNTSYYGYDSQHRVLSSQTPIQHANNWSETFTYDANGNKTGDTTANGDHQSWIYDYYGRVQSHVDLNGSLTTDSYDANSGLLTSVASNWAPAGQSNPGFIPGLWTGSGTTQTYTYYADGQVASDALVTAGTTSAWDNYQYDVNGNQTVDASYTTDGAGQVVHTETLSSYDSHNRLSTETTLNPDNSVANSRTVTNYDAAGNRRAVFTQSAYGPNASPITGNGGVPTGSVAAQTAAPGQAWNFGVASNFTDNIGFGLTFAATQSNGSALPSWMSFNSNGNFTGSPSTAGSWSITVTATDVNGQSVSSTFTVTVPLVAPVFTAAASNQSVAFGTAFSFTVPGATDANGLAIGYSTAWINGSNWVAIPSWLHFNAATLTFSGTPPAGSAGTYQIAYGAGAGGFNPIQAFNLSVSPTPPVYSGGVGNQTVNNGRAFSFSYPAGDFVESDGDALTFSAGSYTMNGSVETDSALPSWMSFNAATLTFTGTPPDSAVGQSFNLYLMAKNPQGQAAEAHFVVNVAQYVQPAPVYHGNLTNQTGTISGSPITINLPNGAFTEPDGGALTYSAMVLIPAHTFTTNKGGEPTDTNVPAVWVPISQVGLSINATTGAITGVPAELVYQLSIFNPNSPVSAHDSTYQLEVIATNGQSGAVSGTFTLTNTYAPPKVIASIPAQTITPNGSGWSYSVVFPVIFSDTYGHGLTYTSNAPAWAGFNNGVFNFSPTTEPAGTYTWTVTATDALGHSASTTMSVTINDVAPVFSGPVNNFTVVQGVPFSYQLPVANDFNGDTPIYTATYASNGTTGFALPSWMSFNASTRTFSGTAPSTGSFTFGCLLTESPGSAWGGANFTLTVNAAVSSGPPMYHGTIANQTGTIGSPITINLPTGAFTEPDGTALSYSAMVLIPAHTYTTNKGGEPIDNPIAAQWVAISGVGLSINASTGTITGSPLVMTYQLSNFNPSKPVYANNTSYQIEIIATDVHGATATGTFTLSNNAAQTHASVRSTALAQTAQAQAATATTPNTKSYWFTYDADNRVVVNDGSLVNGQILVTDGSYGSLAWANQYDAAGNVTQRTTVNGGAYTYTGSVNPKTYNAGDTMTQRLVYDARNELVETDYAVDLTLHEASLGAQQRQFYDADGHQTGSNNYLRSDANYKVYGTPEMPKGWYYIQVGGWLTSGQATGYNADGVVTQQVSYLSPYQTNTDLLNLAREDDNGTLPDGGQSAVPSLSGDGLLIVGSSTTYTAFDHADNVTTYNYNQPALNTSPAYGANYTVNYLKKDGYLEQSTTGTATVSGYLPATDTSYYDDFGRRLATWQNSQAGNGTAQTQLSVFAYDAAGEIVQRRLGTGSGSSFTPTGGNGTDHYTYVNGQQVSDMDEGGGIHVAETLSGFSDSNSTQSYTVQTGDTLAGIAQAVYGNSQLSYVIADANGLSGDNALVVGQRITLPSITTTSNTANTFKPYNPSAIQGSTTPSLPAAPPPPSHSHHCDALAEIVVIAVQVVVSYYAGPEFGSLAGQLVGDALGVHQGISVGEVAEAWAGAAAGAAEGAALSTAGTTFTEGAAIEGGLNAYGNAIVGATSYAASYEAGNLTGQASHFSWAGLVASAAGSAAGGEIGPTKTDMQAGMQSGDFWSRTASNAVQDVVTRETRMALGDSHVQSWEQLGEDVFGNALGNAAIAGITYQNNKLTPIPVVPYKPEINLDASPIVAGDVPQPISPVGYAALDAYGAQQDEKSPSSSLMLSPDDNLSSEGGYGLSAWLQGYSSLYPAPAYTPYLAPVTLTGVQVTASPNAGYLSADDATPGESSGLSVTSLVAAQASDTQQSAAFDESVKNYVNEWGGAYGGMFIPKIATHDQLQIINEGLNHIHEEWNDHDQVVSDEASLIDYAGKANRANIESNDALRLQLHNDESLQFLAFNGNLALMGGSGGLLGGGLPLLAEAYEGTRVGSVIQYMFASRAGAAVTSGTVNTAFQLVKHDGDISQVNLIDVAASALSAYAGVGGNSWWNLGVGTAVGGLQTEANNLFYNRNQNVFLSALTSGVNTWLGFLGGDRVNILGSKQNPTSLNPVIFGNVTGSSVTEGANWSAEKMMDNADKPGNN